MIAILCGLSMPLYISVLSELAGDTISTGITPQMFGGEQVNGLTEHFQVSLQGGITGPSLSATHARNGYRRKNPDDGDHDDHFEQAECFVVHTRTRWRTQLQVGHDMNKLTCWIRLATDSWVAHVVPYVQ